MQDAFRVIVPSSSYKTYSVLEHGGIMHVCLAYSLMPWRSSGNVYAAFVPQYLLPRVRRTATSRIAKSSQPAVIGETVIRVVALPVPLLSSAFYRLNIPRPH